MSSVTKNSEGSKDSSNVSNKIYYKRLLSFTESGETCDVEFRVGLGNVVIRGHKAVFSVASDVFYAMFYSELKEEKVVIVEDLDSDGFQSMKEFIYTGEINFNSLTHALTTFIAARKYIVSELVFNCTEYIENNIHPTELLEFFEYCQMYKVSEFEKLCCRIVREKTDKVMESKHFIAAKPETVEFVLKSLSLTLKSEVAVFDYFEKWALAEADRRNIKAEGIASSFNILKDYMKFSNITADDFVSKISQSMLYTSEEKLAISIKLLKIHTDSKVENLPSFPRVLKKCSTRLTFPIEGTCSSSTYTIELGTYSFNIDFFKKYGYIIITITPLLNSNARLGNDFLTIYTELRVLGNGRFYDDLIFKNDSKLIVGESGDKKKQTSDLEFSKQQILAAIFIGDLRNERFLRGVDNKNVTVVGTFVITKNAGNLFQVSSP